MTFSKQISFSKYRTYFH